MDDFLLLLLMLNKICNIHPDVMGHLILGILVLKYTNDRRKWSSIQPRILLLLMLLLMWTPMTLSNGKRIFFKTTATGWGPVCGIDLGSIDTTVTRTYGLRRAPLEKTVNTDIIKRPRRGV